jgi:hypothetical protein
MATPSKEQKDALLKAGTWAEFTLHVEELKRTMRPAAALTSALERYLPAGSPVVTAAGRSYDPPGVPVSETKPTETKPTEGALRKQGTRKPSGRAAAPPASVKRWTGESDISDWIGKEASTSECIRWVARFVDVMGVTPEHCPDPQAWNVLKLCREFPAFKCKFFDTIWTKTIEKVSADNDSPKVMDGQPVVDHIERIQGLSLRILRGSSEVEHRIHNPGVAGSSPAPATNGESLRRQA